MIDLPKDVEEMCQRMALGNGHCHPGNRCETVAGDGDAVDDDLHAGEFNALQNVHGGALTVDAAQIHYYNQC